MISIESLSQHFNINHPSIEIATVKDRDNIDHFLLYGQGYFCLYKDLKEAEEEKQRLEKKQ